MIPINKGKAPKALTDALAELRSTPNASMSWNEIRDQRSVREALCSEQGGLCAYCMRRITADSSHVEHIVPQSLCAPGQDVAYDNMLAVCDGNEQSGSENALTCDRARGNAPLTVNPLRPETLANIRYRGDGLIYSTDDAICQDLQETLNLNCEAAYLPENRKAVITELTNWLSRTSKRENPANACAKRREKIMTGDTKPEFAGVLLFFLDKQIRKGQGK